jgi:hypothetical protein
MSCQRGTITLKANTIDQRLSVAGDFFFIEDLTRSFDFKLNGAAQTETFSARSRMEVRSPFHSIQLTNSSATDIVFTYYAGSGSVRFLDVVLPPTRLDGSSGTLTSPSPVQVDIAGVDANGFRRKQIVIGNKSTTENLYVYIGGTGTQVGFIPPLTSWTIETDATLRLVYAGVGSLDYTVAELYYK